MWAQRTSLIMNYGFSRPAAEKDALRWVRDTNDKRSSKASFQWILARPFSAPCRRDRRALPGGALAALSFAREAGIRKGSLVRYMTSFDVHPAESLVGGIPAFSTRRGKALEGKAPERFAGAPIAWPPPAMARPPCSVLFPR